MSTIPEGDPLVGPHIGDSQQVHPAIADLLQYSPVVPRKHYPELATQFDYAVRRRELVSILPGVYSTREGARDWRTLASAIGHWDPNAIIAGEAAAALTFWPELVPRTVEVVCDRIYCRRNGFTLTKRHVPPELVTRIAGTRVVHPNLVALDLVPHHAGDGIDVALRSRMATLAGMHRALELTPHRRNNADRRLMLLDSRGEPWSGGERIAHQHLRAAGVTRWHANVPIVCDGKTYFQDIAMDDCPVSIEIDGRIHLRRDIFEADRKRGNALLLAGRHVLHFTGTQVMTEPEWFVETTKRAIGMFTHGSR